MIRYWLIGLLLTPLLIYSSVSFAEELIFQQKCRVLEDDDYLSFMIKSRLKEQSPLQLTATAYEDENCQLPYLIFNRYFEIILHNNENINLKTTQVTYTILTDEVARALNSIRYCGITHWKSMVETDVTGKKCDDYQQLALAQNYYQKIKITHEQLHWGQITQTWNGLTESTRPQEFESEIFNLIKP